MERRRVYWTILYRLNRLCITELFRIWIERRILYIQLVKGGVSMEHGDNNYIVCYNDDCKYWRVDGKCKYYETGNCIEIVHINGMPVCDSFEKRE